MQQFLLLLLLFTVPACAQTGGKDPAPDEPRNRRADSVVVRDAGPEMSTPDPRPEARVVPGATELLLGDAVVTVATYDVAGKGDAVLLNALNLHDDESTSVDAARVVVNRLGGRVVELVHTGDRNISFGIGGQSFEADPNRIFTDAGRRRTLAALSTDTPAARSALAAFADAVLAEYTATSTPAVVTLHNNTENNYGTRDYLDGGQYEAEAAEATLQPGTDPDDFFFVTDRALYNALVAKGFNAVLQDNDSATDDGSLSVWAAQNGLPYVNVEAQHGHSNMQARMLNALVDVLNDR